MKKLLRYFLILIGCLFLLGCQQSANSDETTDPENMDGQKNDEGEETNMSDKDIFDFKHIDKAPEASEKKSVNEVIKVFLGEWSIDIPLENEAVAIDIESNEMYVNPIMNHRGLRAQGGIVQISNGEKVIEILEKYNVQEWKNDYSLASDSDEDGYSWRVWLQFEDGTVQKHKGNEEDNTPENFDEFVAELRQFAQERLEEN